MKVILIKNVDSLGKAGQVKNVSDGYARNYLLPKGLVQPATEANVKNAEVLNKKTQTVEGKKAKAQKSALSHIKGLIVTIKAKATPEGKLFAGIDAQRIVDELRQLVDFNFPVGGVMLDKPIKQTGQYKVDVQTGENKETIELNIINENEK